MVSQRDAHDTVSGLAERYGRDVDQVIKDMNDGGHSRRALEGQPSPA